MVAFITASLIGILGLVAVVWQGKRRAPGARLTWGEAYVAAAFAFFMFLWWYGVIPHLWLTWADNGLNWRSDRLLYGVGSILKPQANGGWLPFTLNWQIVRDIIAVVIYVVGLGLQIAVWSWWNNRQKRAEAAAAVVPTSTYGRPLVRKG